MLVIVLGSYVGYLWHAIVNRPHLYEASVAVADARMLAGDGSLQNIREMIEIAKSRSVVERTAKGLEDELGIANPEKILATLKAERIGDSDLVAIKVSSRDYDDATNAANVLASEAIRRLEELGQGAVRIVESERIEGVDSLGSKPIIFLFVWPVLMLLTGCEIGYVFARWSSRRSTT